MTGRSGMCRRTWWGERRLGGVSFRCDGDNDAWGEMAGGGFIRHGRGSPFVMAGPVPATHVFLVGISKAVDGRAKPCHDGGRQLSPG